MGRVAWISAPLWLAAGAFTLALSVEIRGYGKHSGVEVNETVGHLWTLRGGRIVAWHVYMDTSQALEAVGLREQPWRVSPTVSSSPPSQTAA